MSAWPGQTLAASGLHQMILEQMQDAVVVADTEGTIRLWNRGAEVLFGFSAAEALGSGLDLLVPPRFRAAHNEGFRQAIAAGHLRTEGRVMTTRSNHKNECRLYVDFSFSLLKDPRGQVLGVVAVARDATARHLEEVAHRLQATAA
ncbi:PAS domain S-box protein [Ramlibacter sp.]|uniref:PAS domain S-box protein n=1 Tax=Ramlibacter sp. TaxID=1917967 RepID=UPI002FC66F56